MKEEVISRGLTTGDWILAGGVFLGGIALGRVLRALLTRRITHEDAERSAALVLGRLAGYVAVVGGLVYALSVLDVRLGPLLGAVGIGGIAIALASQSLLANFLSSVILQVRRPFKRGDEICTNDCEGKVEEVNFRTVILRTWDGERVFVPSAAVVNAPIVNFTSLRRRRTTLTIGVAYDTHLESAQRVLQQAVAAVEGVLESPAPEALVESFGESSVDFAVRYWHRPETPALWQVRSRVAMAAKSALEGAGITIPFPQRVVHLQQPAPSGSDSSAAKPVSAEGTET
ncbi:MAG TPA: mechanosensitive ion channel family protein [Acidimicrobiales bacterium]|nr:mechanosensitive ion channel family protein [Acidimicrobiales bacterium]